MQNGITLFELNASVKAAVVQSLPSSSWVIAEISELSINRTGHCYMELIEKDSTGARTIAKARATIWAGTFRMLKPYFETSTGHEFSSGLKVLLNVSVEFHEIYGFSLNVKDIEPAFTIGDIEKRRKEIIARLEKEGVLLMNREIEFPLAPQKIAIISSETAAGYGDFIRQLESNPYSYKFYHKLFPASMQGENTEPSIVEALDKIFFSDDFFDVVVIIRGGGSKSDLNSFDSYRLASHIAQFTLPVISGIGHERDETIVDIVAHTKCKTPTAVAEFLTGKMHEFESHLDELLDGCLNLTGETLEEHKAKLNRLIIDIGPVVRNAVSRSEIRIEKLSGQARAATGAFLEKKKHTVDLLENTSESLKPENTFKRGYSMTLKNGKILKNTNSLENDDLIDTLLFNGKITSRVLKSHN